MTAAALTLDQVSHSVMDAGIEKRILAPISRTFAPGKFHVVGGPSGSGKTTLLSILALAVPATRGMVFWGQENLTRMPLAAQAAWRRQNLGMVFQTSRLIGVMNPLEHIRLAAAIRGRPQAQQEGIAALHALGLGTQMDRLPTELSGGEKQRVAIVQATCARPAILLADEPTAALDQTNASLVAHTLSTFARQNSAVVICVSHDRVVMDAADELLMLTKT